ncbi:MAG TPA: hypothetical protein VFN20_09935 [Candidatus Acidoferrum sp.]|nr:hypothetical protein [Candidatus Acidoferrum sp.]
MNLQINGVSFEIEDAHELQKILEQIHRRPFAEVWMQPAATWPTICALVNADAAWLMYLRFDGNAGFSTRNPDYSGAPNAVIEYRLTNGQRDEYPAAWDISTVEALRALTHFFEKKEMAPWLVWHENS